MIRETPFTEGEFYHIFNRGVDKRSTFSSREDVDRFLLSMREFNTADAIGSIYQNSFARKKKKTLKDSTSKLVYFVAYCLNPNHYHFILEQVSDRGIEKFMQRLGTGYTNYFNGKYKRSGALFQGKFKSVHIGTNEQLLHVSAYVNLNDRVHNIGEKHSEIGIPVSSWAEYLHGEKDLCKPNVVMEQFENSNDYKKFALDTLADIQDKRKREKEHRAILLE